MRIREPALEFVIILLCVAADARKTRGFREPGLEFVIVLPYVAADARKMRRSGAKKIRNFKPDFDHQVSHQNEAINFKKNRFKDKATFEGVDVRKIRGFRSRPLSL